ncbi:septum site-determining protein MinC [Paenisporosarcina antarctica]|uniref:Probable septum site-determining protein MinC n=1 Tax=Paenisporosarcina antarctica TaxID=417367 RepID=A0A4P6ZXD7_9BACL|nr:septum site-determining protein MinC [Paenisporosarcina antarctica]QBP40778.1 septum site-determining protein MinC [Paenisporosarcina antarctica]
MTNKHLVSIKGTKDGLVLRLDDQCAYADLVEEIKRKVSDEGIEGQAEVLLQLGNRYCSEGQKRELIACVHTSPHLRVSRVQSDVISVEESNQRVLERQSETFVGIVRSGQVVRAEGDLVVVGDVNPNGKLIAGGNIFVLGRLKGIAHAGAKGNKESVIAASWLEATHLMIAEAIELMTDELTILSEQPEMECAYLHANGFIAIDRLQELRLLRPQLSTFRGGS